MQDLTGTLNRALNGNQEEREAEEVVFPSPSPLPLYRKVAYGTANFINLLAVSMWFPYSVAFYQKVLLLPAASAGTIILAGQIGGALSTPILGDWSDRCRCKVPGRRKVFQLVGMVCVVCSFFFMWHECLGCSSAPASYKVLYYSSFAVVFQFGWAATQLGQISLIPELAPDKATQVELNSIRYAFSIIGNLVIFICFWILLVKVNDSVDVEDLSPQDRTIFWIMALVVILLGVPVSLIFQFCIHEKSNLTTLSLKWHEWIRSPRFFLGVCGYAAARLMIILPQTYLPLYFIDTLRMDKTSIAKGPLVLYITGFVATIIIKRLNRYIGVKMLFFCGIAIAWSGLIWLWVADPSSGPSKSFLWPRDSIYGAIMLLGAGGAITNVLSMVLVAYLIGPYSGSSSFVYGWVVFADRLTNGVVVKIIQQFQPLQSSLLPDYYRHVVVFTPFAGSVWSLIILGLLVLLEFYEQKKSKLSVQDSGQ